MKWYSSQFSSQAISYFPDKALTGVGIFKLLGNNIFCLYSKLYINLFLIDSKLDCIFPIVKYGHPIQRALKINSEGLTEMIAPENMQLRSQDLESRFHDLGQFYFFNTNKILKERKLWTNNTGGIEISEMESHDIDTIEDWKIAEKMFEVINNK